MKLSKDYGYSNDLVNVINRMLNVDDFQRIGYNELSQVVGVGRG